MSPKEIAREVNINQEVFITEARLSRCGKSSIDPHNLPKYNDHPGFQEVWEH